MRFREINETKEAREQRKRAEEEKQRRIWENGAGKIKPETDITVDECNEFWNNFFNEMAQAGNTVVKF